MDRLEAYRERDWRGAMDRFTAALEIDAGDGPSQTLLMQARILRIRGGTVEAGGSDL